jgi:preprotein translocase subunit Sec63
MHQQNDAVHKHRKKQNTGAPNNPNQSLVSQNLVNDDVADADVGKVRAQSAERPFRTQQKEKTQCIEGEAGQQNQSQIAATSMQTITKRAFDQKTVPTVPPTQSDLLSAMYTWFDDFSAHHLVREVRQWKFG